MRSLPFVLVLLAACQPLRPLGAIDGAPGVAEGDLPIQEAPSIVPGAYVLRVHEGASVEDPALADLGLTPTAAPGTYRFSSDASPEEVSRQLDGAVAWVEPVIRHFPQSNDEYYDLQWHLPQLRVDEAWAWTRGAGAVVAVIDTGVLRVDDHGVTGADGIQNLLPAHEYLPVEPLVLPDGSSVLVPDDDVGHGTHIASTIAQRTDNTVGGAGIAPDAAILPIRALGQYGGTSTDIADAIRYATDNGAQVVNLSLGSPLYSDVIAEACQYAYDNGVVLIAAAGNDGHSNFLGYPAALDTVLSVGAVGPDGVVTDYSNRGPELDVVAPGGVPYDLDRNGMADGVLAETWTYWYGVPDVQDGTYIGGTFLQGTSMATATVSGVAALLVAQGATRDEIFATLTSTAVDLGDAGWDPAYGHGLVDAAAALEAFAGTPPAPEVPRTAEELVAGDLVVTEIMADPSWCASDSCEWVEVENASATSIDLQGLVVRDAGGAEGTVDSSVILAPGGLAVLGRGSAAGWDQPDIAPDAFYGTAVTLNNGGDTIFLGDVASASWSDSEAGVSAALVGGAWVLADSPLPTTGERATPHVR